MVKRIIGCLCAGLWMIVYACQPGPSAGAGIPEKIIFDTDMGSDCDDAGALALLHSYADQGKAEILACIYSSGKVPYGAGVVEAINIYYGRGAIPVGATYGQEVGDSVDKMGTEKLARDTAAFKNRIIHNTGAEEQTRLNRRILAAQPDHSVTYLTVGHTKGLYDLLVSTADENSPLSGLELVRQKIKRWVALGALGAANTEGTFAKDWNFFFNGSAPYTQYLVAHFPAPVVYVDGGTDVMTGKSLKTTPPGNIVRTAYRDWLWNFERKTLDDQRPSWDLVTVYYALEGPGEYLTDTGNGRLEFDPEKGCRWHPEAGASNQTYILQKPGIAATFAEYLNKRISGRQEVGSSD
jgi:hypothetical protein